MTTKSIQEKYPTIEDKYNALLKTASSVIAYPHKTITSNDKHRAIVLMMLLSGDCNCVEHICSQLTQEEFKVIKQIKDFIYAKEITN